MYSSIEEIDTFDYVDRIISSEKYNNYTKIGSNNKFDYNFCDKMPFNEYEILSKMLYENNIKRSFRINDNKAVRMICWAVDKGGKILSKGISNNTVSTLNNQFYNVHKKLKHNGKHAEIEMIYGLRAKNNNTEYMKRILIPNNIDTNMGRTTLPDDIDEEKFKNLKYVDVKHIFIDNSKVDSILIARLSKRNGLSEKEKHTGWNIKTSFLNDSHPCTACKLILQSYFEGTDTKLVYKKGKTWYTEII